jgi:hypothetical protein
MVENFSIRVNNQTEAEVIQKLFFSCGCSWHASNKEIIIFSERMAEFPLKIYAEDKDIFYEAILEESVMDPAPVYFTYEKGLKYLNEEIMNSDFNQQVEKIKIEIFK